MNLKPPETFAVQANLLLIYPLILGGFEGFLVCLDLDCISAFADDVVLLPNEEL